MFDQLLSAYDTVSSSPFPPYVQHLLLISFQYFDRASIILFLNKKDLLEEKISRSHLDEYFPDFDGPRRDVKAARDFILGMFQEVATGRSIYSYFTCVTGNDDFYLPLRFFVS